MVGMRILGLSVDSTAKTPILLLQEVGSLFDTAEEGGNEKRVLPIWIGSMEAMSISLALSGKHGARPLTHDLTMAVVEALGGSIESIEITNFHNGTFYTDLVVRQGKTVHRVDCRPSDGITLALKQGMLIYVHPEVLENSAHAEQRQDAASFRMFKGEEERGVPSVLTEDSAQVTRQDSKSSSGKNTHGESTPSEKTGARKGPRVQHITITPQPRAHVKTLMGGESKQEGDMEQLLKSMDVASSTKM